ncbi:MAG: DUF1217 domain-containing protein [Pseudomonadota bacterium]
MLPTLVSLDVFQRTLATGEPSAIIATEVERETQYFRDNIGQVTSAEDLMADFRLYRYALTAFDLSDTIDQRAIIERVLAEDTLSDESLVNRLPDERFLEMAEAFDFAVVGAFNLGDPAFIDDVADRYRVVRSEEAEGEINDGVRLASYFLRNVGEIDNWFEVLADPPMREVVFTALGIPQEVQGSDVDRLADELERRFAIEDFQDPEELDRFVQRFAIQYDIAQGSALSGSASAALSILQSTANFVATNSLNLLA